MHRKRIFRWLSLDMVIFVVINAYLILHFQDKLSDLSNIGYFKFLVLGLAAYRAANILSNETVTKPLRAPFVDELRKDGKEIELPKKSGFLGAMGLLIYCPSCTGVWISAALIYSYIFYPTPTFIIALFFSLSAMERIFSAIVGSIKNYKKK